MLSSRTPFESLFRARHGPTLLRVNGFSSISSELMVLSSAIRPDGFSVVSLSALVLILMRLSVQL